MNAVDGNSGAVDELGLAEGLPAAGLPAVEFAVAAGTSERKLRRWHSDGLLQEPARCWVGKRRVSLYAPREVERVQAVGELMARYHNTDRVALGLLALGYEPREDRLRAAYDRFLERQERWFVMLAAIFDAPPESVEADKAVANFTVALRTSRHFRWARRAARALQQFAANREQPQSPAVDATWDYVENVTSIFIKGGLGSDQAVRELLGVLPMESPLPMDDQVRITKALHRATKLSTLKRIAAEVPLAELTQACDEVVTIVVGYLVSMDAGPYLNGKTPESPAPLLCEVINIDPSALAYFGLLIASFKRDPEAGEELTNAVITFSELFGLLVSVALTEVNGRVPVVEAIAARYLGNRIDREFLFTRC